MDTDYNIFITVSVVLIAIGYLYFHLRAKSGFQYLKSKYGMTVDGIYGHTSVDQLIRGINIEIQNWLDIKDSTVIDIDGETFPLIFGGVIYPNYHQTGSSIKNAYFLITDETNKYVINEYPNLFKFSETNGEYSVYWATDIKGLIAFKNREN